MQTARAGSNGLASVTRIVKYCEARGPCGRLSKLALLGHHRAMFIGRDSLAISLLAIVAFAYLTVGSPAEPLAQPRFGIEASVGQGVGFTPYVDNAAYLEFETPTLANEIPGSGAVVAIQLVFESLEANLTLQFFDREQIEITHVSDDDLPPGRVRPDGTIDDAGISYTELDESRTITVPDRSRGGLILGTLGAAYRWYVWGGELFDVYLPLGGGLGVINISEPTRPWVFGLFATGGVGASFDVAPPVGLFVNARVSGLLTPSYLDFDDASRAAVEVGDSTEAAAFDTMVYGNVLFGIQFTVR